MYEFRNSICWCCCLTSLWYIMYEFRNSICWCCCRKALWYINI
jgi:hypothetical protein